MTRDLFEKMLSRDALERDGARYTPLDKSSLAVLVQSTTGGPTPIVRIEAVELLDGYVAIETHDTLYCLPYDQLAGLRIGKRGEASSPRTGFHA